MIDQERNGATLRSLRKRLKMTQRELARTLHIDFIALSKMENDRIPLDARVFDAAMQLVHTLDLEACPFCGFRSEVSMVKWPEGDDKRYFVRCSTCDIVGPWARHEQEARDCWNERPAIKRLYRIEVAARAHLADWESGDTFGHESRAALKRALEGE